MSTWWRVCKACGEPSDDPWRCPYCGEPVVFARGADDDWKLLAGVVLLMGLGLVLVISCAVLVLQVTGGS